MPNEVTITRPPGMPFNEMERLGEYISKSNLFGIRTKEQAIVLMAIAQAEGRHPVEAARDYDIVNNRPAKKAEAMMRDFIQAGGKIEWHALTDELADATFTHPQTGSVRIDWDMKRALTAFGKKDMYAKFPRQMLRSRVVSEGVRTLWPLATSGMYVPEEQADIPAHTGPTIDAEAPSAARQAINDAVPLRSVAAATPRAPRVVDPTPYEAPPPKPVDRSQWTDGMWRSWIDAKLRPEGAKLTCRHDVVQLGEKTSVKDAIDPKIAPEWVQRDVTEILHEWFESFPADAEATPDDDLDEVVIAGEDKILAG